jgi:hypothetical protein
MPNLGTITNPLPLTFDNVLTQVGFSGYFTFAAGTTPGIFTYLIYPPTGYYIAPQTIFVIIPVNAAALTNFPGINQLIAEGTPGFPAPPLDPFQGTISLEDSVNQPQLYQYFWLNLANF